MPAKGCFYRFGTSGQGRFYRLKPELGRSGYSPIIINSVRSATGDIISAVPCFNNVKVLYGFGQKFGKVEIGGVALLGPAGNTRRAMSDIQDWFDDVRSSTNAKRVIVSSLDGFTLPCIVTDLSFGEVNAEYHILPFSISATVIEA